MTGEISFSMAQVVGKVARAEDEEVWLAEAELRTVREMRLLVRQQTDRSSSRREDDSALGSSAIRSGAPGAVEHGHAVGEHLQPPDDDISGDELSGVIDEELETLTVTVDREDAWLFECARMIGRRVSGLTESETIEALLGEGTSSLLARVRRDDFVDFDNSDDDVAQRQWEAELARWREEAEARCEGNLRKRAKTSEEARAGDGGVESRAISRAFSSDGRERDASAIDAELRRLASELATRDLALGRLAEAFWKADGWRRLGYATAVQYARERLGTSLSSMETKRGLARRVEEMPPLSTAIETAQVGYEAARLVASVATVETVAEWLARAEERTVRFLREEVDAMKLFARLTPGSMTSPPSKETMQALGVLESRIVSGAVFRDLNEGQMSAGAERRAEASEGAPQSPVAGAQRRAHRARHRGRVTLRFRLSAETRRYYRWLERLFARCGPPRVSFVRFLCCALIDSWQHTLGSRAEYAHVYARDRYRCMSPVCGRRDVTPHHLQFRSARGDDSLENLASLCVWCHLEGIHGGRLRASPPASDIAWSIGRQGHTEVFGRRRVVKSAVSCRTASV
jgi:hypothetical protein